MKPLAVIMEDRELKRLLTHLNLPTDLGLDLLTKKAEAPAALKTEQKDAPAPTPAKK